MSSLTHHFLDSFFLGYGLALFFSYALLAVLGKIAIKNHYKKSTLVNKQAIKAGKDLPSVTLIAPAYNEGKTIITNVYSLLSIQYANYKLTIINDGSEDDSLYQLIKEFDLEMTALTPGATEMSFGRINNIYKSTNPKYFNLTVIDKVNGGRADALNAGIAYATSDLILCTDADCVIEQDALLKMVRPYLEAVDQEIIACGGGIGIANDSIIENGTLKELKTPKKLITKIQVVEYMRAFLIGRMGWSQVNGLMLVSGAFGMYPRKRVLEVGGFNKDTVGEDLELCIHLRKNMEERKLPYKVVYIPDTLCWTEAPSNLKSYISQRDRWARGLLETLKIHKDLMFNSKYGAMGKFIFPYWVIFELGAPFVELLGVLYIFYYSISDAINWPLYCILLCSTLK